MLTNNTYITTGYVEYYYETILGNKLNYAGRLPSNTLLTAEYDDNKSAMKIITCDSDKSAVNKYIINISNLSKVSTMITTEAKTAIDNNTGNIVAINTNEDGTITSSDPNITDQMLVADDAFINTEYSKTYTSSEQYINNLQDGLRVKDLRGILGMPHQFLPTTDPRIDNLTILGDEDQFGRVYSEKIIKHIPLLLMTPGSPVFMAGYSTEQKNTIVGKLAGMATDAIDSLFNDGSIGKYYSLKYAYTDYFNYVNPMLRSAACFLEIQDEEIDGQTLGTMNWLYSTCNQGSEIYSHGNLANFLGPYAGCIAFYADAGTTVDDSFSNSTSDSQLASTLNNLSESGKELNFLIGNVGGMAGVNLDLLGANTELNNTITDLTSQVDGILGGGNVMSNILGKATTILAGGRLIFPEIWSDSSFSRSYSCSMKLISPSGDKLSVFLNILVPLYHLLAFTLPRESTNQAYFSPFLVRAYYKGLFNVDMGIIPGLSVTKGDEGEWTIDGIPTVANVSFEIKDLYEGFYMSEQKLSTSYGILSNTQELDYIANTCGININDQEIMRTIRMAAALGFTKVTDKVTIGIFGNIAQYFNQKMQNIFGIF